MNSTVKKTLLITLIATMLLSSSLAILPVHATPAIWNVEGSYVINVKYLGVDYPETLILSQSGTSITGVTLDTIPPTGVGGASYFVITSGSVVGNDISIFCEKGSLIVNLVGKIAADGTMGGDWYDAFETGARTGTWQTTEGNAVPAVIVTFPEGSDASATVTTFIPGGEGTLPPLPGTAQGTYYDITVTGTFDGKVKVCVPYDPELFPNPHLYIGDPVDFNHDGTVNGQDIAAMQKAIKSGANDPTFDINHDHKVNNADLLIVKDYASHGLIVNQGQNGVQQARLPWMDITVGQEIVNGIYYVCGETDHFSGFGVH